MQFLSLLFGRQILMKLNPSFQFLLIFNLKEFPAQIFPSQSNQKLGASWTVFYHLFKSAFPLYYFFEFSLLFGNFSLTLQLGLFFPPLPLYLPPPLRFLQIHI